MFGMQDPRLGPAKMRPAWQSAGPMPPIDLPPGFRPPGAGGGMPGMSPEVPQMGMPQMPMMPFGMMRLPGQNEQAVNKTNDMAGTSDPMAQGAAQAADMGMGGGSFASWLRGLF